MNEMDTGIQTCAYGFFKWMKGRPGKWFGCILCAMLLTVAVSGCSIFKRSSGSGGGYYQNDGPGDPSKVDANNLPDAVPRVEPLMSGPNKPYTVNGKRYVPDTREVPYRQRGRASWYGRQFHGRQTSSGEVYDMYAMTAAHTTLPIPCYVRVTNVSNGRTVIVRVNDRGPFSNSRIIDLSYAAATKLDFINQGTAEVIVERIMPADIAAGRVNSGSSAVSSGSHNSGGVSQGTSGSTGVQPHVLSGGYFVQIGAYSTQHSAQALVSRLSAQNSSLHSALRITHDGRYYRVYAGPYSSQSQARNVGNQIESQIGARVLILERF